MTDIDNKKIENIIVDNYNILIDIHNKITSMYTNNLYDDHWEDNGKEKEFNDLLTKYNEASSLIEQNILIYPWDSKEQKENYLKVYYEVLKEDKDVFNAIARRHIYFWDFYHYKGVIIQQFNKAIGLVSNKNIPILTYYIDNLDNIPLYKLRKMLFIDIEKNPKLENTISAFEREYGRDLLSEIFVSYKKYRVGIVFIFDGLCSSDPNMGYLTEGRYHIEDFCKRKIKSYPEILRLWNLYYNKEEILSPYKNRSRTSQNFQLEYGEKMDKDALKDFESFNFNSCKKGFMNHNLNEEYDLFDPSFQKLDKNNFLNLTAKINTDNCNRIIMKNNSIYSNTTFYPKDIIEICPCKIVHNESLFSRDVRDIVFEITPNKEWAIPFGYVQYYNVSDNSDIINCDYIFDPNTNNIIIKAIKKIPEGT